MLISLMVLALGANEAPRRDAFVGTWEPVPVPGVLTIDRLTFTREGRLWAGATNFIGDYTVDGTTVRASSRFGDTHAYAITTDGQLCVYPGPALTPLASDEATNRRQGQCYRKVARTPEN